ncbi:MAG: hypothetical protein ACI3ZS_04455, partial [Candidatus Cryptobacteroides sp.]
MRRIHHILSMAIALVSIASCIENDLSYPDVDVEITALDIDKAKETSIDYLNHTISVTLEETASLSEVKVNSLILNEGAIVIGEMPEVLDLRQPYRFQMKVYEVEDWTISATLPIDRYINCDYQIGDAVIDAEKKTAYVYIADNQSLGCVTINSMKLEPEGSAVASTSGYVIENGQSQIKVEACAFPMVLDCTLTRHFSVEYNSNEIDWAVTFLSKPVAVDMTSVNAWTYSAELEGITNGKGNPVFEYCIEDSGEWIQYSDLTINGTKAFATLTGLFEDTVYQVRMSNGEDVSEVIEFRTGQAAQLENMDFETWHQADPRDCWYPFPSGDSSGIWGTANPGTNFINPMNPTRPEFEHVAIPGSTAVRLES